MRSVYLDSCVIIEALEKHTPEGHAVVDLVVECVNDEFRFVTSDLALMEVLVDPIKGLVDRPLDQEDSTRRSHHDWYQANLTADGLLIQTLPITRDVLIQAALIRARIKSIKTPDAIHVATALNEKCSRFITGDGPLTDKLERDHVWLSSSSRFRIVGLGVPDLEALKAELRE